MKRVILAAALLAALAGCSKEPAAPSAPTPAPKAAGKEAAPAAPAARITKNELDAVTKAAKAYRLTLIVKTRNNPFFTPMINAFTEEAKSLGCTADVQSPPQETDAARQFDLVSDVIAKGTDAILIAPADSKGIVPALKKAQEKGILVVNLDNRVDAATAKAAGLDLGGYVGADNEEGGKLAGQAMVEALHAGQAGGRKPAVAILEGIRGVDNAEARKRGFESAAAGSLDIATRESAEWETDKAYAKMQSILAAQPSLGGVFCANDNMAIGAIKAIRQANKKLAVVGYDNLKEVHPYLASGDMYATIEQHPDLMGRYGAKMAAGILAGTLKKGYEFLVPLEVIKK